MPLSFDIDRVSGILPVKLLIYLDRVSVSFANTTTGKKLIYCEKMH